MVVPTKLQQQFHHQQKVLHNNYKFRDWKIMSCFLHFGVFCQNIVWRLKKCQLWWFFTFPFLCRIVVQGGQIYNLCFGLISYTVPTPEIATMYFQTQTRIGKNCEWCPNLFFDVWSPQYGWDKLSDLPSSNCQDLVVNSLIGWKPRMEIFSQLW